jgi:hypothetical protein
MLRFPNPSSDISGFIRIYIELYNSLSDRESFGLDDFTNVLIERNLATSSGFAGGEALERSTRADRSRDPLYNQSKSYSELYKILGWLHPISDSALNFRFTFLGAHVVAAGQNVNEIFKQSILGIVYPNSIIGVSGSYILRPFVTILRTMAMLDGKINREEMIVGPLCLENDRDSSSFMKMVDSLRNIRGSNAKLNKAIVDLERKRNITRITMGNYTRFPIAVLQWTGWATRSSESIYGRSSPFFYLSEDGYKTLELVEQLKDVRNSDLADNQALIEAVTRIGFYQMLERAGFDVLPVKDQVQRDAEIASTFFEQKDSAILFSPFQDLEPQISRAIFPETFSSSIESVQPVALSLAEDFRRERTVKTASVVNLVNNSSGSKIDTDEELTKWFKDIAEKQYGLENAINHIFNNFAGINKEEFYPLVARLFRFLGYDCEHSRAGVNYQRWDAIIKHESESIPIEIKSPGEEEFISVKAVRQALENKIILLSRKPFPTKPDTTTLVVGYRLPNNRAEVVSLIDDIYKAYGVIIGVIDTRSLLVMVAAKIFNNKTINHKDLVKLHGVIEVSYT